MKRDECDWQKEGERATAWTCLGMSLGGVILVGSVLLLYSWCAPMFR